MTAYYTKPGKWQAEPGSGTEGGVVVLASRGEFSQFRQVALRGLWRVKMSLLVHVFLFLLSMAGRAGKFPWAGVLRFPS